MTNVKVFDKFLLREGERWRGAGGDKTRAIRGITWGNFCHRVIINENGNENAQKNKTIISLFEKRLANL